MTNEVRNNVSKIRDYAWVKEHLLMEVVSESRNADRLEGQVHRLHDGLALIYRIALSEDLMASCTVLTGMMEGWGITEEELHADALASQKRLNPPVLMRMSDILGVHEEVPMFVGSVRNALHGAAFLEYPEELKKASQILGGDYYIIPSSIHELIFLPKGADPQAIEQMIRLVNQEDVREEDVLSNDLYHYDHRREAVERIGTYLAGSEAKRS